MEKKMISGKEPETMEEISKEVLETVTAGEGEAPACACEVCGKTFKTVLALACHMATHSGRVK